MIEGWGVSVMQQFSHLLMLSVYISFFGQLRRTNLHTGVKISVAKQGAFMFPGDSLKLGGTGCMTIHTLVVPQRVCTLMLGIVVYRLFKICLSM